MCCSSRKFQYGRKPIVYKVAVQCTDMKFTSAAYNTREMVKQREVFLLKVTLCCFSVYDEFNSNSIEIGLCVQLFAKLLPDITIFHYLGLLWSEKFKLFSDS